MIKKSNHVFVCGRCGYRSHSKTNCPTCKIKLEEQCKKCLSAKGNCVCRIHGTFNHGIKLKKKSNKSSKSKKRR